jgi:transporter family protein
MAIQPWALFAIASAFFASLTAIFGKLGVQGLNSNLATFIRTIVIVFLLGAVVSARKEWSWPREQTLNNWIFLVVSALCTGLSWLCYYRALQLGPASKVAPIDKLSVALTILLAALFLGESLSWKTLAGAGLILAGTVVIALAG